MTIEQFIRDTAGYPANTELMVLSPWGDMEPAAFVSRADLADGDPVKDSFPTNTLLLAGKAN